MRIAVFDQLENLVIGIHFFADNMVIVGIDGLRPDRPAHVVAIAGGQYQAHRLFGKRHQDALVVAALYTLHCRTGGAVFTAVAVEALGEDQTIAGGIIDLGAIESQVVGFNELFGIAGKASLLVNLIEGKNFALGIGDMEIVNPQAGIDEVVLENRWIVGEPWQRYK